MNDITMNDIEKIRKKIKKCLDKERYHHTLGVMYTASALAMRYEYPMEKAMLAGLLHDCAKCIPVSERFTLCDEYRIKLNKIEEDNPALIHAKLGAVLARVVYHINDEEILSAIRYHTTGRPNMTKLEKIIYIADYIEPNRLLPNIEHIRTVSFEELNQGLCLVLSGSLNYLKQKNLPIDSLTDETYQYYKGNLS